MIQLELDFKQSGQHSHHIIINLTDFAFQKHSSRVELNKLTSKARRNISRVNGVIFNKPLLFNCDLNVNWEPSSSSFQSPTHYSGLTNTTIRPGELLASLALAMVVAKL